MKNIRRKDREQSRDFALEVTDSCAYANLATVNTDGSPYCVPLSIAREGEWIFFHSATAGHKLDNLRQENRVCVSCVGNQSVIAGKFSIKYESAIIFGTATEIIDEEEKIHALKLICLRHTPDNMANFDGEIHRQLNLTSVWKIHIDEISGKARKQ